jgi:RNA recognition motif-containing protein
LINIFIGNLALEITKDELRKEFTKFGEVNKVVIMNDKCIGSGQPIGYGYVEMVSKSDGANAVTNLDGKKLRNLEIKVIQALPLTDKHKVIPRKIKTTYRSNKTRKRNYTINLE